MTTVNNDDSLINENSEYKLIAPDSDHPNCFRNVTEYKWADAFRNQDIERFSQIFHEDATQSASTSPYTNFGFTEISETFGWASHFYERCDFMYQASAEGVEFLEFDLTTANQMHMTGMTVLTKDSSGNVIKVFNGHRNLTETVLFTEHFVRGQKNKGTVALFHKKAVKKYGIENKYPRNPVGFNAVSTVTETEYVDAFRRGEKNAFYDMCDSSVSLSSSYVANTVDGVDAVSSCLELMADFYEHCTFVTEAKYENRTYLLYNGRLRNGLIVSDGFLILVRNEAGKIIQVLDNPIPMHAGTMISAYIADHHPDSEFAEEYLYNERLFSKAVAKYTLDNVYGKNTRDLSSYKGFIANFFIKIQ